MDSKNRELRDWFDTHFSLIREELFQFLQFPSISTDPSFRHSIEDCAEWVHHFLQNIGMQAEIWQTTGAPVVYAKKISSVPQAPTLLIYGHYDVQPVDPLSLWQSDPFQPQEREGRIYARGASDDKGQVFYALLAARLLLERGEDLPVNLKFCIEGEEESGSQGLSQGLARWKEPLKADYLLVPDFQQFDQNTPAISLGARGLICAEVTVCNSFSDLHSGIYGGVAYNPLRALTHAFSAVWDAKGRVQIPGFYEGMQKSSDDALSYPCTKEQYQEQQGIQVFADETGSSLMQANWTKPVFEIHGIVGGYTGEGVKTVIPQMASAKFSCRLVPGQDLEKITQALELFFQEHLPEGMQPKIHFFAKHPAFRVEEGALARAIAKACEEVCSVSCRRVLSGGSLPILAELKAISGAELVGMGYALAEDQIHAPNENFDWERLFKGFATVVKVCELLGRRETA